MLRSALTLAAVAMLAAPAAAATYSAKLAAPQQASRIAVSDLLWTCGEQDCVGSTKTSRPLVLCQGLAKKAGRIDAFTVDGRDIAAAELERCNASARASTPQAVATAR